MARTFDPVQLGSIELFCKAADCGSFTAAAEALGLTPAAVSRSIARLEARLGVRLFARTTRSIRLTSDGALYKAECQQALEQIAQAEQAITGQQQRPSGLLRVSAPSTYAHHRLLPLLPRFQKAYPEVQIELNISNRNIDFVDDGYDIAIRRGQPPDSRLIARLLEDATVGVFASPSYLRRRGTPKTTAELLARDCIQFILPSTGRPVPWVFRGSDGRDIDLQFASPWRVEDDVLGCLTWAQAGGGLCQIYHFAAQAAVARGELVEVMKKMGGRAWPFWVLYPQNRHLSARVRVFVDFLTSAVTGRASRGRR
ncbi:LysR family transcriptional regulator [Ideonella sp. BN130291]|uniref:LysR family transcriptional regulator n=1 Tax=Ideonella sp. BN130291 TaxID=3112940 RepID=UPI002E258AA2|nr:LysR substrate-binding domain-containing protein [Ideonella sp. BN130291]